METNSLIGLFNSFCGANNYWFNFNHQLEHQRKIENQMNRLEANLEKLFEKGRAFYMHDKNMDYQKEIDKICEMIDESLSKPYTMEHAPYIAAMIEIAEYLKRKSSMHSAEHHGNMDYKNMESGGEKKTGFNP